MKKVALVTGGSRGIGEAICRKLYEDGYIVCVNYVNSKDLAEELAKEINGLALQFDISDKASVKLAIEKIRAEIGEISLLINNAGVSEINLFTHISDEMSEKILNTNLKGTLNCSREVLPDMINVKSGNIINISSMWGQVGASCEVDYSATKAGIIGFTKALAQEVAPSGIRVNCISPGFILTEMNKNFTQDDLQLILDDIPLSRFGTPLDIAETVSFLASEKSSFITGQNIAVNGGMVL